MSKCCKEAIENDSLDFEKKTVDYGDFTLVLRIHFCPECGCANIDDSDYLYLPMD